MTEVFNFFQAFLFSKNIAPARISKQEVDLALLLKREARKLMTKADEEMQNAQTTQTLAFESVSSEKTSVFTKIAVWHSRRAAERYLQAMERFEEAGRVQIEKNKSLNLMAKEMMRRAAEAKAIGNQAKELVIQN